MKTTCRKDGETTSFVFVEVEPELEQAVSGLYYLPAEGGGFAKEFAAGTPDLDRIFARFEHSAQAMVRQAARLEPVDWTSALKTVLELTEGSDIDWWLCGSAALAARGIDVAPGDLDLVVSGEDAQRLSELLSDYLVEPLQLSQGWIWSAFGRAFPGARVEWVGDVNEGADIPEPGDFGPVAAARLETIEWEGHQLRVPPLELQLAVSERRGPEERVEKIRAFLTAASSQPAPPVR